MPFVIESIINNIIIIIIIITIVQVTGALLSNFSLSFPFSSLESTKVYIIKN